MYQIDTYGNSYDIREVGPLNVKKILEVWDWLNFQQGRNGLPLWDQGEWFQDITEEYPLSVASNAKANNGLQELEEVEYCGTACCVAGFIALPITEIGKHHDPHVPNGEYEIDGIKYGEEGRGNGFSDVGREVLGLTYYESEQVFNGGNTREDIQRHLNAILENRGQSIRL